MHWSTVGDPRAPDAELMAWARAEHYVVFTNDLDFSAILATTTATGPSVVQVRTQDVLPEAIGPRVVDLLRAHAAAFAAGAVATLDTLAARVRLLPLRPPDDPEAAGGN